MKLYVELSIGPTYDIYIYTFLAHMFFMANAGKYIIYHTSILYRKNVGGDIFPPRNSGQGKAHKNIDL